MTAATLEEVLAEVARDHDGAFCICGDLVTDPEYHLGEKQAAAVRSWLADRLADEGLREAVAAAIHASDCGCPDWRADDQEDVTYPEDATAALAAVTAALAEGAGDE